MTPLGHLLFGYLLFLIIRRVWPKVKLWEFLVGALVLDADAILLITGGYFEYHRMFTHSVVILAGVALIVSFRFSGLSLFFGGLVHLGIDMVMLDTNPADGVGVHLLWPLFDAFSSLGWFDLRFYDAGFFGTLVQNAALELSLFSIVLVLYLLRYVVVMRKDVRSGLLEFFGPVIVSKPVRILQKRWKTQRWFMVGMLFSMILLLVLLGSGLYILSSSQ